MCWGRVGRRGWVTGEGESFAIAYHGVQDEGVSERDAFRSGGSVGRGSCEIELTCAERAAAAAAERNRRARGARHQSSS